MIYRVLPGLVRRSRQGGRDKSRPYIRRIILFITPIYAIYSIRHCTAHRHVWAAQIFLPVFEAVLDDVLDFFCANIAGAIDKQTLLLERAIDERGNIGLAIA